MIRREWNYFLTALLFFTRMPVPKSYQYKETYSSPSSKYLTLIGWLVGWLAGGVFYVASFVFPIGIAVLLSMISTVFLTGAFHEDGFADVCDGFGGGWGKENILKIMKDSTVGAYALIGTSLLLLLKFNTLLALAEISNLVVVVSLINAHTSSRFMALSVMYTHAYVRDEESSKVKTITRKSFSWTALLYSFLFALLPFFLLQNLIFLLAFLISYLAKVALAFYFNKQIGGYTGDCLGAVQQVTEVVFYLSIIALWNYM